MSQAAKASRTLEKPKQKKFMSNIFSINNKIAGLFKKSSSETDLHLSVPAEGKSLPEAEPGVAESRFRRRIQSTRSQRAKFAAFDGGKSSDEESPSSLQEEQVLRDTDIQVSHFRQFDYCRSQDTKKMKRVPRVTRLDLSQISDVNESFVIDDSLANDHAILHDQSESSKTERLEVKVSMETSLIDEANLKLDDEQTEFAASNISSRPSQKQTTPRAGNNKMFLDFSHVRTSAEEMKQFEERQTTRNSIQLDDSTLITDMYDPILSVAGGCRGSTLSESQSYEPPDTFRNIPNVADNLTDNMFKGHKSPSSSACTSLLSIKRLEGTPELCDRSEKTTKAIDYSDSVMNFRLEDEDDGKLCRTFDDDLSLNLSKSIAGGSACSSLRNSAIGLQNNNNSGQKMTSATSLRRFESEGDGKGKKYPLTGTSSLTTSSKKGSPVIFDGTFNPKLNVDSKVNTDFASLGICLADRESPDKSGVSKTMTTTQTEEVRESPKKHQPLVDPAEDEVEENQDDDDDVVPCLSLRQKRRNSFYLARRSITNIWDITQQSKKEFESTAEYATASLSHNASTLSNFSRAELEKVYLQLQTRCQETLTQNAQLDSYNAEMQSKLDEMSDDFQGYVKNMEECYNNRLKIWEHMMTNRDKVNESTMEQIRSYKDQVQDLKHRESNLLSQNDELSRKLDETVSQIHKIDLSAKSFAFGQPLSPDNTSLENSTKLRLNRTSLGSTTAEPLQTHKSHPDDSKTPLEDVISNINNLFSKLDMSINDTAPHTHLISEHNSEEEELDLLPQSFIQAASLDLAKIANEMAQGCPACTKRDVAYRQVVNYLMKVKNQEIGELKAMVKMMRNDGDSGESRMSSLHTVGGKNPLDLIDDERGGVSYRSQEGAAGRGQHQRILTESREFGVGVGGWKPSAVVGYDGAGRHREELKELQPGSFDRHIDNIKSKPLYMSAEDINLTRNGVMGRNGKVIVLNEDGFATLDHLGHRALRRNDSMESKRTTKHNSFAFGSPHLTAADEVRMVQKQKEMMENDKENCMTGGNLPVGDPGWFGKRHRNLSSLGSLHFYQSQDENGQGELASRSGVEYPSVLENCSYYTSVDQDFNKMESPLASSRSGDSLGRISYVRGSQEEEFGDMATKLKARKLVRGNRKLLRSNGSLARLRRGNSKKGHVRLSSTLCYSPLHDTENYGETVETFVSETGSPHSLALLKSKDEEIGKHKEFISNLKTTLESLLHEYNRSKTEADKAKRELDSLKVKYMR